MAIAIRSFTIFMLAIIPSVLLILDQYQHGSINTWLLVFWFICAMISVTVSWAASNADAPTGGGGSES